MKEKEYNKLYQFILMIKPSGKKPEKNIKSY